MDQNKRRWAMIGGAAAAGVLIGGLVFGTVATASAQEAQQPSGQSQPSGQNKQPRDESQSQRPDEHLLTGTDADKARAAALAKYPGATIQRVETDSDGVYEAHLTTADGKRVTVEMDKNFVVTGEEQAPGHK